MQHCYLCNASIPEGQGVRREIVVGHSSGVSFRRRMGAYSSTQRGIRTLCANCARRRGGSVSVKGVMYFFGALVFLSALARCGDHPSDTRQIASPAPAAASANAASTRQTQKVEPRTSVAARAEAKQAATQWCDIGGGKGYFAPSCPDAQKR